MDTSPIPIPLCINRPRLSEQFCSVPTSPDNQGCTVEQLLPFTISRRNGTILQLVGEVGIIRHRNEMSVPILIPSQESQEGIR